MIAVEKMIPSAARASSFRVGSRSMLDRGLKDALRIAVET
jgi:hypothetical protein